MSWFVAGTTTSLHGTPRNMGVISHFSSVSNTLQSLNGTTIIIIIIVIIIIIAYHQIPTRHIPTRWECVMIIRGGNVTLSYKIHHSYMGDKFRERHGCTLFAWVTRLCIPPCIQKHILRKCIRWHLHCMWILIPFMYNCHNFVLSCHTPFI